MKPDSYTLKTLLEIEESAAEENRQTLIEMKQQWIESSKNLASVKEEYMSKGVQYRMLSLSLSLSLFLLPWIITH